MATDSSAIEGIGLGVRQFPAVTTPLSPGVCAGIVGLCDAFCIVFSGLVIRAFRAVDFASDLAPVTACLALFVIMAALSLNAAGLYRFTAILTPARHMSKIVLVLVGVFLVLISTAFALKISSEFSRLWAFTWLVSSSVMLLACRSIFARCVRSLARAGRMGRRILVYGANDQARKLIERIERLAEPWNHIVGVFDDRLSRVGPYIGRYPVLGNRDDLIALGRSNPPDEILVALPGAAEQRLLEVMQSLAVLPANIRLCPEFFHDEMIHGRTSYHFGLPMLSAFEKPLAGWDAIGKRIFDVVFSSMVLIAAAPVVLLIAGLIKLDGRGPVLFRQKRYGFNNEVIDVFKFRTMRVETSEGTGERPTLRNDSRVTRVGAFLRRSSLDELPQVMNVLLGEMSIVGPRPHALRTKAGGRLCEDIVDRYSVRHKVKPGITGWAQVNGWRGTMQDEQHLRNRVAHDLYYINHWSIWFDLNILFRTLWIVINGRNSY